MSRRPLTEPELADRLGALSGWSRTDERIVATAQFPTFPGLIAAVDDIAITAEASDHHPDLDIRWRTLHVRLTTYEPSPGSSAGPALTALDLEAAAHITDIVHAHGGTLLPANLTNTP